MVAWALKGYPREVSKDTMLEAPELAFDMLRAMGQTGVLVATLPGGGDVQLGRVVEFWAGGVIGVGLIKRKTLEEAREAVRWTFEHGKLPSPLCGAHTNRNGYYTLRDCQTCSDREGCEDARP